MGFLHEVVNVSGDAKERGVMVASYFLEARTVKEQGNRLAVNCICDDRDLFRLLPIVGRAAHGRLCVYIDRLIRRVRRVPRPRAHVAEDTAAQCHRLYCTDRLARVPRPDTLERRVSNDGFDSVRVASSRVGCTVCLGACVSDQRRDVLGRN